jgi:hypothetical protein
MESTMRATLCLTLVALASPAVAAPSIADQAHDAYAIFAGGLSQQEFLTAHVGDKVFSRIAGNWVRLNGPQPGTGIETYGVDTDRFCKSPAAVTLASADPLSLTVTTNLSGANFTQQYTLIAGSTFGEHTDPKPYFDAVGLGPTKTGDAADQQRALLLSLTNGVVQIYRPSEDILVIARERGYPIVLARCPAPESASAPPDTAPASSSSSEAQ